MVATPDKIPSDLTLEIGDDISPDRFMAAVRAFFGYVHEIGRSLVTDERELPQWRVHVREGSALLALEPATPATSPALASIYARAEAGIHSLAAGNVGRAGLSEPALKHLRALSEVSSGPRGRHTPMRLWVKRHPVELDEKIARVIDEDWRVDYRDFGTIEGRLESIQDKDGSLILQVRDPALRQSVRCYFPEAMLERAFALFRKRVEVSGLIHYRKNGTPVSIDISQLERLPDDDELPSAEEVKGILRAPP